MHHTSVLAEWRLLEARQKLNQDAHEEVQRKALCWILTQAVAKVTHYRSGVRVIDGVPRHWLQKMPVLEHATLQEERENMRLLPAIHAWGLLGLDAVAWSKYTAGLLYWLMRTGYSFGMRVVTPTMQTRNVIRALMDLIPTNLGRAVHEPSLQHKRPIVLVGPLEWLLAQARVPSSNVRGVLCLDGPLHAEDRAVFEQAWHAPITSVVCFSEGFTSIAKRDQETPELLLSHVAAEILDEHLVLTDLVNYATPRIRYDTGLHAVGDATDREFTQIFEIIRSASRGRINRRAG